jgi:Flp pilus assembly protein TadD
VKLDPSDGDGWNTLGLALCRAEASQGALDALAKAMEAKSGGDAHDWYLVAIAQWQLGRKEEARQWYEKAVSGRQGDPRDEVERDRLRQEVAALLGIG